MLRLSTTDKVSYAYCLQGVASKNAALTENSILSVKFNVPFFSDKLPKSKNFSGTYRH